MSRVGQAFIFALVAALALPALAQAPARPGAPVSTAAPKPEIVNIDAGKTGEQLFKSNCAICHKTAVGLSKTGGLLGVQSFLRSHYTASRESAAIIGAYLYSVDAAAPPARGTRQRANPDARRTSKKPDDAKATGAKPAEVKPGETKPAEVKPAEAKAADEPPRPSASVPDSKPVESKPAEAKPAVPAEQKPADAPKPE